MKFRFGNTRQKKLIGINEILSDIIDEFNGGESFLIFSIRRIWPDLTGNIISSHSIPERIFKKTLFISVDHSVYANELIVVKDSIIKSINDSLSGELIKNLKIEVRKIKWNKPKV